MSSTQDNLHGRAVSMEGQMWSQSGCRLAMDLKCNAQAAYSSLYMTAVLELLFHMSNPPFILPGSVVSVFGFVQ